MTVESIPGDGARIVLVVPTDRSDRETETEGA
jgi:hypothetical protein